MKKVHNVRPEIVPNVKFPCPQDVSLSQHIDLQLPTREVHLSFGAQTLLL